jgi:hypothetical protein
MPQERYDSGSDSGPAQAAGANAQPRENPAGEAAPGAEGVESVLTLVCEKCGKDYFFQDDPPPDDLTCEKCGGTVFRAFHSTIGDEAADDFRDSTERDLRADDAEGDTLPGDLMDLNRI